MHIKICGITNIHDALSASEAGADYLGFNFYSQSPRYISPDASMRITAELRQVHPAVKTVGIFVNQAPVEMERIMRIANLNMAQLSGDESISVLEALTASGIRAYKALRGPEMQNLAESFAAIPGFAPSLLVDGAAPGFFGGSGKIADWETAAHIAQRHPIFLAGGLTAENAADAIRIVHPWGVDTASGVEAAPGRKDPKKMAAFLRAVREACTTSPIRIETAIQPNASEILILQKLAYQSEAELNRDFSIPPLTQTLSEMEAELGSKLFLKAVADERIIGSVHAELREGVCRIGRLCVHPDWQNQGIGSQLIHTIEANFPSADRYELFTGERSTRNLYLYQKLGYTIIRREPFHENVTLVHLAKAGTQTL